MEITAKKLESKNLTMQVGGMDAIMFVALVFILCS
jgi:hypothetical protein